MSLSKGEMFPITSLWGSEDPEPEQTRARWPSLLPPLGALPGGLQSSPSEGLRAREGSLRLLAQANGWYEDGYGERG